MQFYPGDKIDGYEILDYLASGGYGSVYKAKDLNEDRTVALKVMESGGNQEQRLERFAREVEILSSLRHNNIVSFYKSGNEEVEWYTMELLEGPSLQNIMEKDWPLHRKVEVLRQIAQALSYMHDQGYIHRDIKPQNIMFRTPECKEVVVFDMGLVHAPHSNLTLGHQILGTPSYLSPEQMDGNYEYKQIDIWAVGIIMFQWLTKSHPFLDNTTSSSATEIMHSIKHSSNLSITKKLEPIDFYLAEVCNKCLAKEVDERYRDGRELENVLSQWQMVHYNKCMEDAREKKSKQSVDEAIQLMENAYLWHPGDTVVTHLKDLWEKKLKRQDIRLLPKDKLESAQKRLQEKGLELIVKETRLIQDNNITITPQNYVVCIQKTPWKKYHPTIYKTASAVASIILCVVLLYNTNLFETEKISENTNSSIDKEKLSEAKQNTDQDPNKVLVKIATETDKDLIYLLQDSNPYIRVYALSSLKNRGDKIASSLRAELPNTTQAQKEYIFVILEELNVPQQQMLAALKDSELEEKLLSRMDLPQLQNAFETNTESQLAIVKELQTRTPKKQVLEFFIKALQKNSPKIVQEEIVKNLKNSRQEVIVFSLQELQNSDTIYNISDTLKYLDETVVSVALYVLENSKFEKHQKEQAVSILLRDEQTTTIVPKLIMLLSTKNGVYAYKVLENIEDLSISDLEEFLGNSQNKKQQNLVLRLLLKKGAKAIPILLRYKEAHNAVAQMGKRAIPKLIEALSNTDTRANAAKILVHIEGVLPQLFEELRNSENPKNIKSIIYVIAQKDITKFLNALKDQSPYVREQAVDIVARIGSPAIPHLLKSLDDPSAVPYATQILSKIGTAVIPYLKKALKVSKNKASILKILANIGPQAQDTLPMLLQLLSDQDSQIREAAKQALVKMKRPAAVIPLLSQETTRDDAVMILKDMGDIAVPELLKAIDSSQQKVRIYSIVTIKKMGAAGQSAIPKLAYILKKEPDQKVYIQAVSALDAMGTAAVDALIDILKSSRKQARIDACILLGNMGGKARNAKPTLESMIKKDTAEVQRAATEALQKIHQGMYKDELEKWHK